MLRRLRPTKLRKKFFLNNVKCVPRSSVPDIANIIGSHTVYKITVNDDESLKLKATIALHGNEDPDKSNLHTKCCMCPLLGIRVVSSTATIRRRRCVCTDAEAAFMQTGKSSRDVYVIPPIESGFRNILWLLVFAAYGVVNSNSKWQRNLTMFFFKLGMHAMPEIPQLFVFKDEEQVLLISKIVDDFFLTGAD